MPNPVYIYIYIYIYIYNSVGCLSFSAWWLSFIRRYETCGRRQASMLLNIQKLIYIHLSLYIYIYMYISKWIGLLRDLHLFKNYLFHLHSCMFPAWCFRQKTFSNSLVFLLRYDTRWYEWGTVRLANLRKCVWASLDAPFIWPCATS